MSVRQHVGVDRNYLTNENKHNKTHLTYILKQSNINKIAKRYKYIGKSNCQIHLHFIPFHRVTRL